MPSWPLSFLGPWLAETHKTASSPQVQALCNAGLSRTMALGCDPHRQAHANLPSDTHHVGRVLDEDLVAKLDLRDHVPWDICPQALLLGDELLQTAAGEGVLCAHVHGPWGAAAQSVAGTRPLAALPRGSSL